MNFQGCEIVFELVRNESCVGNVLLNREMREYEGGREIRLADWLALVGVGVLWCNTMRCMPEDRSFLVTGLVENFC